MPISLAKLVSGNIVPLKIEVGQAEPLRVSIYQNKLTPRLMQRVEAIMDGNDEEGDEENYSPLGPILTELVAGWDLVDEKGEKLPVTEETIEEIPYWIQKKIITEAGEEVNPPQKKSRR